MSQRRGRRYNAEEVNALLRPLELERDNLRLEVASLRAKQQGLLAQLADADDALMQIEGRLKEVGRQDAMGAHPSLGTGTERLRRAATVAPVSPTGGNGVESIRPRLRVVPTTDSQGEQ